MTSDWNIVIISSNTRSRQQLIGILEGQGWAPICASNISAALEMMNQHAADRRNIGLIFCDHDLPDGSYRDFLTTLRAMKAKARVVVTSRLADWDEYLDAMRLGAFDVIAAPCQAADVEWMLIQANREERNRVRAAAALSEINADQPSAANA
jgi:DNA-binding NtrC family response regulator